MKLNKILMATAVVFAAVAFTGCIREVFPKESAITEGQLAQSTTGMETMLKSVPSSMAAHVAASYDHSDFGYHSIGLYKDHHAMTMFPCARPEKGGNPYYSRIQAPNYGFDMGTNGGYTHYIWYNYYPFIKKANDIIGAAEEKKNDDSMAEYMAIARTFRALFYLDLVGYYDSLPAKAPALPTYEKDLEVVIGLTVPIVTEDTKEETAKENPRATRATMFEFIFEDLEYAMDTMAAFEADEDFEPTVYGQSTTYPELAAVYGLIARAYMWLGQFEADDLKVGDNTETPEIEALADDSVAEDESDDEGDKKDQKELIILTGFDAYQKAYDYAELALAAAKNDGASFMTPEQWTNVTTGINTVVPSWIWATQMSTDTVINNLLAFAAHVCPEASYGYGPLACVGVAKNTYDKLGASDIRKKLIAGPDKTYEQFKQYTSMSRDEWTAIQSMAPYTNFKFRPGQGERIDYMVANAVSLPIMRLEELEFIAIEAMLHTGNASGAMDRLETFLQGYRAPQYFNNESSEDAILKEIIFQKSVEFWGEGVILFDMKRLDMGVDTTNQNYQSGMLFKQETRLPWWNLPLPSGETAVNTVNKSVAGPDPSYGIISEEAI